MSMKPGTARKERTQEELDKLIKEAELANMRVGFRAEMRSAGEDEDSSVIDQRVLESQRGRISEVPEKVKPFTAILAAVKTPAQAVVALALIAAVVFLVWKGIVSF